VPPKFPDTGTGARALARLRVDIDVKGKSTTMTDANPVLRIGDIARRSGVSTRSLRYYEEQGLLVAERTPHGQRVYSADAVERVRLVQQLYAAGLPSRSILDLLPCVDTGVATPEMLDVLVAEHDRISLRISELEQARSQLGGLIGQTRASVHSA